MRFLLCAMVLAGCNTPSVQFLGVEPVLVEAEGRSFKVYRQGDRAQAIRIGSDSDLSKLNAATRASIAIQKATGCEIRSGSLTTDRIITNAALKNCQG